MNHRNEGEKKWAHARADRGWKKMCGGGRSRAHQFLLASFMFHLSTRPVFLHNILLPCKAACSPYKDLLCRATDAGAGWIQHISTAPYWVGGPPRPPTESTASPRSHLIANRGLAEASRSFFFFPSLPSTGNCDANEKSVNQRGYTRTGRRL